MPEHQDILRKLVEADQRTAERRKRKKPTAKETFTRLGMDEFLKPKVAPVPQFWWHRDKPVQKEAFVPEEVYENDLSELLDCD